MKSSRTFETARDLFDSASSLGDSEFDDALWLLLCTRVKSPLDVAHVPPEVSTYYASRLVQWEVGNGGFAQAAYNVPEWFPIAASAYDTLGKPEFANLIRTAQSKIPDNPDDMEAVEGEFEALDDSLAQVEWEIDGTRIAFAREHRDAFVSLDTLS